MATVLADQIAGSADPPGVAILLQRIEAAQPEAKERLGADPELLRRVVTVSAASPALGRLCLTDPAALDVLEDVGRRPAMDPAQATGGAATYIARWKQLELLRIAARDLTGEVDLEWVGLSLADLADDVLTAAWKASGTSGLAVVAMGKLGARELNYASDIDLLLVGEGDPRSFLEIVRQAWKVDLDLRPEGRAGPLTRSLDSYLVYWERWARTWEFQALLKARPVAGEASLGARFAAEAAERVWGRRFGEEELREVRTMKARAEEEVVRRGLSGREIKRGPGGIRDIEFAVQLLQLVHERADPTLRVPATLPALAALRDGGYVALEDASSLEAAYRWLRTVEHRLQLVEERQVHTVPESPAAREHLARVLGFRDEAMPAVAQFDAQLRAELASVRSIHERLFFRPLLEAFTSPSAAPALTEEAVATRLEAFGFSDAERTRLAINELTRGLSRGSQLMRQLLPLALTWLSASPDPDLGLLGLRALATGSHRRDQLVALCRESPEAARQLCLLLGTGPAFTRGFERHPDLLGELATGSLLGEPPEPTEMIRGALSWRADAQSRQEGLAHTQQAELIRIAARDVLGKVDVPQVGAALTGLAEDVLEAALEQVDAQVPLAVIAMGRFGGAELAYGSDLDALVVFDPAGRAEGPAAGLAAASSLLRLVNGETPALRLYTLDTDLRPEGRHGPLARSLGSYAAYYMRWAQPWERQALLRGRFAAGDPDVGARFAEVAERFIWDRPFTEEDAREIRRSKARIERERIPAGEDPAFHLKLGRGSLSDIEWTAQLLQLRHGVRATGTLAALDALRTGGYLDSDDYAALAEAYRFCELARNRLYLVRGVPGDSLPSTGPTLTALARSLATAPTDLREDYRRATRRSRRVMERLFYGRSGS